MGNFIPVCTSASKRMAQVQASIIDYNLHNVHNLIQHLISFIIYTHLCHLSVL
jgi:hypothetical protein